MVFGDYCFVSRRNFDWLKTWSCLIFFSPGNCYIISTGPIINSSFPGVINNFVGDNGICLTIRSLNLTFSFSQCRFVKIRVDDKAAQIRCSASIQLCRSKSDWLCGTDLLGSLLFVLLLLLYKGPPDTKLYFRNEISVYLGNNRNRSLHNMYRVFKDAKKRTRVRKLLPSTNSNGARCNWIYLWVRKGILKC